MLPHTGTLLPADVLRAEASRIADDVIAIVREHSAIDFSGYRRGTIERRILNRMTTVRLTSPAEYVDLLRRDGSEVARLTANLTVKVSRFYRNAGACEVLRERALPLLREAAGGKPLRLWSAGCANGEEAYTLALLAGSHDRVDATDIDSEALDTARAGEYEPAAFEEAPAWVASDYFEPGRAAGMLRASEELRRRVRFFRHDLTAEEPSSRYHLVACRNLLIYFAPALQARVLRRLVDALLPGGFLWLGEAEWPAAGTAPELDAFDRKNKIFRLRAETERYR